MTSKRSKAASEARKSFYSEYRACRDQIVMAENHAAEMLNLGQFDDQQAFRHVDQAYGRIYARATWPVAMAIVCRHPKQAYTRILHIDGGTMTRVDAWLERYDSLPENYARLVRSELSQNLRVLKRGDFRIPG